MHCAQNYIRKNIICGKNTKSSVKAVSLSSSQALRLVDAISKDAVDYYYSSIVTIADAIRGIGQKFYCWSTVKLYYSVFYSARSILASNDVCVFYVGKSAYCLKARAGESPAFINGTTHSVVNQVFEKYFHNHILLSQDIDLDPPIKWLEDKRVEANYRSARFSEPGIPRHLEYVVQKGVRRAVSQYVSDGKNLYTFDPEHSALAFPLKYLASAGSELDKNNTCPLTQDDANYLLSLVKDGHGPIPAFKNCGLDLFL